MKYLCKVNREWMYDEIISEEVLVFSAPDDFSFSDIEVLKKVLPKLGYKHVRVKEGVEGDDSKGVHLACKKNKERFWSHFYTLTQFMDYPISDRKLLIEILEKDYDVKLLNLIMVE